MAMIYVKTKPNRKAFYEGKIIPQDKFIPVTDQRGRATSHPPPDRPLGRSGRAGRLQRSQDQGQDQAGCPGSAVKKTDPL